jgi:hypothetical protein
MLQLWTIHPNHWIISWFVLIVSYNMSCNWDMMTSFYWVISYCLVDWALDTPNNQRLNARSSPVGRASSTSHLPRAAAPRQAAAVVRRASTVSMKALADRLGDHTGPRSGLLKTKFLRFTYKYRPILIKWPALVELLRSASAWKKPSMLISASPDSISPSTPSTRQSWGHARTVVVAVIGLARL